VKVSVLRSYFSIRSMNSVIHFAIMCIAALPPDSLGRCNVNNRTLKIAPFHRNHNMVVFVCRTLSVGGGGGVFVCVNGGGRGGNFIKKDFFLVFKGCF